MLNADDHRVLEMAENLNTKAVYFGSTEACDYRAEAIESIWPERLHFKLYTNEPGEQGIPVHSQLIGKHWLYSVLATLVTADFCGVSVQQAVQSLNRVDPFMGGMQAIKLPNGAIAIRDEENVSPDTINVMLEVLSHARADRRGLIFSDQSDSKQPPRKRLSKIGRLSAKLCDFVVFVGPHPHHAVGGQPLRVWKISIARDLKTSRMLRIGSKLFF